MPAKPLWISRIRDVVKELEKPGRDPRVAPPVPRQAVQARDRLAVGVAQVVEVQHAPGP